MSDSPPSGAPGERSRHARHERPTPRRLRFVQVLLGLSWLLACVVAFAIGFAITGTSGAVRPGAPRFEQPGMGAALVGISFAMLVFIPAALISNVRERRRRMDVRYPGVREPWYAVMASQIRHSPRLVVLVAAMLLLIPLGFWMRHRYG